MSVKTSIRLFTFYLTALLLLGDGYYRVTDEWHFFLLTEAMATRGSVAIPEAQFVSITSQTPPAAPFRYTYFPLGYPLAALPVHVLQRGLLFVFRVDARDLLAGGIECTNAVITALLLTVLARLLARMYGQPRRAAGIAAAVGFGTILLQYARSNFSESLQALLLLGAVALILTRPVLRDRRAGTIFGILLGWLFLTKLIYLFFIPGLLVWAVVRDRGAGRRPVFTYSGLPLLLALAGYGAYNYARSGDCLDFYYADTYTTDVGGEQKTVPLNFSDPPWHGLAGYLFSPGKSIFLTSPLILLALPGLAYWRRQRLDVFGLGGFCAGFMLLYACFTGWEGGLCWGPRFLVPLVPLLALFAAPVFYSPRRLVRALAWSLAGGSLLLQLFIAGNDAMLALCAARPPYGVGRYYPLALNPYPPMLEQYRRMFQPAPPPPAATFNRLADPARLNFWWCKW